MSKKSKSNNKKAVALRYKKDDSVPKVIAKGKGYVAENIINKAKEEKIEIYRDKNIIDSLMNVEMGKEIPYELYEAVAEIICFVYMIDKEKGDRNEQ